MMSLNRFSMYSRHISGFSVPWRVLDNSWLPRYPPFGPEQIGSTLSMQTNYSQICEIHLVHVIDCLNCFIAFSPQKDLYFRADNKIQALFVSLHSENGMKPKLTFWLASFCWNAVVTFDIRRRQISSRLCWRFVYCQNSSRLKSNNGTHEAQ